MSPALDAFFLFFLDAFLFFFFFFYKSACRSLSARRFEHADEERVSGEELAWK